MIEKMNQQNINFRVLVSLVIISIISVSVLSTNFVICNLDSISSLKFLHSPIIEHNSCNDECEGEEVSVRLQLKNYEKVDENDCSTCYDTSIDFDDALLKQLKLAKVCLQEHTIIILDEKSKLSIQPESNFISKTSYTPELIVLRI